MPAAMRAAAQRRPALKQREIGGIAPGAAHMTQLRNHGAMDSVGAIQNLWHLNLAATALVIARLFAADLYRKYPGFVVCLSVALFRSLIFAFCLPDPRSPTYRVTWVATEPIVVALQVFMAREIVRQSQAHYKGIGSFAKHVLLVFLGMSVLA